MANGEWGMVANYKLVEMSCKLMPNALFGQFPINNQHHTNYKLT